jgi:riboflavin kinase/FMN adenylyltransferase
VKVYTSYKDFKPVNNAVVTIGTFDGVHLGHQKIIQRIKALANTEKGETVIVTFYPHPRAVLNPGDTSLKLIDTLEEKIQLLENFGIDHLIVQPFTKEFSDLSALDFIQEVLVKALGTKILVIGYNHQFGHNREGNLLQLEALAPLNNFSVEKIEKQDLDSIAISSTQIRNALYTGAIDIANLYSGHDFTLKGTVVKGRQLGRTIGFPTANIVINDPVKIVPGDGVYAVLVCINKSQHKGMLNIGKRPSVQGLERTIEVNIFDFDQDIYGKEIEIVFKFRIRSEQKFESLEELKMQLIKDQAATTILLS